MEHFKIINLAIILISYFIGTFPTASIITKLFIKEDILQKGTGNAGAMNTYEVTKSRIAGISVFLIDAIKGFIAVSIARYFNGEAYISGGIAAVWVIIGHNYNIFLKYRGGRGLSTAAGAFLAINPLLVILWGLMWLTSYMIVKKDIIVANAIALVATPVMIFSSPNELIHLLSIWKVDDLIEFKILSSVICFVILLKHVEPLKKIFSEKKI